MADPKGTDRSDEMEEDLGKLEDHIAEAEKQLEGRKKDAAIVEDVTGEPGGEQDTAGDDPKGAEAGAGQAAPSGSQDDPVGGRDDDDADGRVDDEVANPT